MPNEKESAKIETKIGIIQATLLRLDQKLDTILDAIEKINKKEEQ